MGKDEPDVLELLIRHELVIKQLYEIFASMSENRREFWQSLAVDEQKHADWLGTLRSESTAWSQRRKSEDRYGSDEKGRTRASIHWKTDPRG
jgi:hypothetical protein